MIHARGQLIVFAITRIDHFLLCESILCWAWTLWMRFAAAILSVLIAGSAVAQSPAAPVGRAYVRFTVENPQLEPAAYTLNIYEDGAGNYSASGSDDASSTPTERAIRIHDPLLSQLFEAARSHHFFAINCEAPRSHVAFTGKKTLAYAGGDGAGSCTFNYSRDQSLNQIATDLMSVAYTLAEGPRLASERLHDRLSLDSELEALQDAAQDRRALELGNIAPELQAIANDDAVMNRARTRARALIPDPVSPR